MATTPAKVPNATTKDKVVSKDNGLVFITFEMTMVKAYIKNNTANITILNPRVLDPLSGKNVYPIPKIDKMKKLMIPQDWIIKLNFKELKSGNIYYILRFYSLCLFRLVPFLSNLYLFFL